MSILTVGSSPGRAWFNLPIAIVPLRRTDKCYWSSSHRPHIWEIEQMLRIPGRGHSVPTVTELIFVRALRFTNFAIKAIYAMRNITGSSYVPHCVNCFYGKVGKTQRSHKNQFGDRGDRMTPAWDSQHLLYLPNMWPVAGTPVTFVRAPQGNYGNREVKPCPARTRTHGQN